jgi:hypothetical protein
MKGLSRLVGVGVTLNSHVIIRIVDLSLMSLIINGVVAVNVL